MRAFTNQHNMAQSSLSRMSWIASIRAVGLFGGRARKLTLRSAIALLNRGLRGNWLRKAVQQRILYHASVIYHAHDSTLPNALDVLTDLNVLLGIDPRLPGIEPIAETIRVLTVDAAHGVLLEKAREWLAASGCTDLLHDPTTPVIAFIDLEYRRGQIREVAVVRRIGKRELMSVHLSDDDLKISIKALTNLLAETIIVAHNGIEHDFKLLEMLGVELPSSRIDTLRWAWLAAPTQEYHSQPHLLRAWCPDACGLAHTALGDAKNLSLLFEEIRVRVSELASITRTGIYRALQKHESTTVLDFMLGLPEDGAVWKPLRKAVHVQAPFSTLPDSTDGFSTGTRQVVDTLSRQYPAVKGAVNVVGSLRELPVNAGYRVLGCCCLDDIPLTDIYASGWNVALGRNLVDATGGVIDAAPKAAKRLIENLATRRHDACVEVSGTLMFTDHHTLSLRPPNTPIHVEDLHLLLHWQPILMPVSNKYLPDIDTENTFVTIDVKDLDEVKQQELSKHGCDTLGLEATEITNGVIRYTADGWGWNPRPFDPLAFENHLSVGVPGSSWERNEVKAFLKLVLGKAPTITGTLNMPQIKITQVDDPPPRSMRILHATAAWCACVLAAKSLERATMLVSPEPVRNRIMDHLSYDWEQICGKPLLCPPDWPGIPDTVARLHEGSRSMLVRWERGRELLRTILHSGQPVGLILLHLPGPDTTHRVVRRMMKASGEPFRDVIEPWTALRLITYLATGPEDVVILDPIANAPLINSIQEWTGRWAYMPLENIARSDKSAAIFEAMGPAPELDDELFNDAALNMATIRLLQGKKLRDFQKPIINDLRKRQDVLAVFRTGLGKSLCYQLPALATSHYSEGITLVISPLIALQRNQLDSLHKKNIWEATIINSTIETSIRESRFNGLQAGFYRLLYVAPEALLSSAMLNRLKKLPIRLVAIDEAHCISDIGHDFRTDYRRLPDVLDRLSGTEGITNARDYYESITVISLTGTASPAVQSDISELMRRPFRLRLDTQFQRPELRFDVWNIDGIKNSDNGMLILDPTCVPWHPSDKIISIDSEYLKDDLRAAILIYLLNEVVKRPTIIYAQTQKKVEYIADFIKEKINNERVAHYHAGMDRASGENGLTRVDVEKKFYNGDVDVLVATNAFGMGVDKGDIRAVIHYEMPASPEALYQEAGRAGRDLPEVDQPARCISLFSQKDIEFGGWLQERGTPTYLELREVWATLAAIADHASKSVPANNKGSIIVTDADLEIYSGLMGGLTAGTVLAHLERNGLLKEKERLGRLPLFQVIKDPTAAMKLTSVQHLIFEQLLKVAPAPVDLNKMLDTLNQKGHIMRLRELTTQLSMLERHGLIRRDHIVAIRILDTDIVNQANDVANLLRALYRWFADNKSSDYNWQRIRPISINTTPEKLQSALELAAAEKCIKIARSSGDEAPRVQPGANDWGVLKPLFNNLDKVAKAICSQYDPEKSNEVSVLRLAKNLQIEEQLVRRILRAMHLFRLISLDPRGWQKIGDGAFGEQARRLELVNLDDMQTEKMLRAAEQNILKRTKFERQKRRALRRYANIIRDKESVDPYQMFLERYLRDPLFLKGLLAENPEDILNGLDEDQRHAVTVETTTLRIVAGPGTGKTHTITRRIAWRSYNDLLDPSTTIALSFTRAAAEELKIRLAALNVTGVRSSTIDALAFRIVTDHAAWLGFNSAPKALNPNLKADHDFMIEAVKAAGAKSRDAASYLRAFEAIHRELIEPEQIMNKWDSFEVDIKYEPDVLIILDNYRKYLIEQGRADFTMLTYLAVKVLADDIQGKRARRTVREIYVDEAQDLDAAQFELVAGIAQNNHMVVVGDPRQAIYTWRGARPELMQNYLNVLRNGKIDQVQLLTSYRSDKTIINNINRIGRAIEPNLERLVTLSNYSGQVNAWSCESEGEVTVKVTHLVGKSIDEGTNIEEIAVLVRATKDLSSIQRAIEALGIQVRTLPLTPLHTTDAFRIAKSINIRNMLELEEIPVSQRMEELLENTSIRTELHSTTAERTEKNREDWLRLASAAREQEVRGIAQAAEIFKAIEKQTKAEEGERIDNGVTVTTIHRAKGREWDHVIVAHADKKRWYDPKQPKEMDRLFYVAASRPRKRLDLIYDKSVGPYKHVQSNHQKTAAPIINKSESKPKVVHAVAPEKIKEASSRPVGIAPAINAKFTGICPRCNKKFPSGTKISKIDGKWGHADCQERGV